MFMAGPDIDEDLFSLETGGLVENIGSLCLKDLKSSHAYVTNLSIGWLTVGHTFLKSQSSALLEHALEDHSEYLAARRKHPREPPN